jgi:hypothetical protein
LALCSSKLRKEVWRSMEMSSRARVAAFVRSHDTLGR